jgi:hypothetical protein
VEQAVTLEVEAEARAGARWEEADGTRGGGGTWARQWLGQRCARVLRRGGGRKEEDGGRA